MWLIVVGDRTRVGPRGQVVVGGEDDFEVGLWSWVVFGVSWWHLECDGRVAARASGAPVYSLSRTDGTRSDAGGFGARETFGEQS